MNTADDTLSGTREYGAFGENIAATGVGVLDEWSGIPFGFSTKYQDRLTNHYYYGYRFYDTSTGRWLSRDPIEEQGGLNLYAFVGNNGVNSWDMLGMMPPSVEPDWSAIMFAWELIHQSEPIYNGSEWRLTGWEIEVGTRASFATAIKSFVFIFRIFVDVRCCYMNRSGFGLRSELRTVEREYRHKHSFANDPLIASDPAAIPTSFPGEKEIAGAILKYGISKFMAETSFPYAFGSEDMRRLWLAAERAKPRNIHYGSYLKNYPCR